jgi:antitoxin component YwqK of YwqJK toxin-antitoxin module
MKLFFVFIVLLFVQLSGFAQEGGLKNIIIKYDTTYEKNNMHKGTNIGDVYVDKGLVLYVYDGPYLVEIIAEKKDNYNNGIYLSFYIPSNMPKEKGMFVNGYEDGEWFYWNEKGKLTMKKIWKKGKVLKTIKYK